METVGWTSILPPILAIGLALKTRDVYVSLSTFIWLGWTILSGWNPAAGLAAGVSTLFAAVTEPANAKTLAFSALIGGIITLTQASGGVHGFVQWAESRRGGMNRRRVNLAAVAVSMVLFIESNFGLLVSGSVMRPLADRAEVSREKLAYLLDSTCAPKQLLIPINAWGAYVVALLAAEGLPGANAVLVTSLPLNFYAIVALVLAAGVAFTDWNIGPMRAAEQRIRETGDLLRPDSQPMVAASITEVEPRVGTPARALNLVLPILVMVLAVPFILWWTGSGRLMAGSGSDAVLGGVLAGLATAAVSYRVQGIMDTGDLLRHVIAGVRGLLPVVIVLSLAFAISTTQRTLGTGIWLSELVSGEIDIAFVPALVFLLSAVMAFSTGTSWGTFAIMIPIVTPMSEMLGVDLRLMIAAALGGGIFGDHCSPISDSTIVASMACATDHVDHVRTQLPYALIAAAVSFVLFMIAGSVLA
jgi:Na+/H+ antiporter NhaC